MAHSTLQRQYGTLDVFTSKRYEGNPLAVVELQENDNVATEQLQLIAREFNFSETVFLYRRQDDQVKGDAEWHMRIFLTDAEVPFAGHPVIGTAVYIKTRLLDAQYTGKLSLVCPAGKIDFDLKADDVYVSAQIPHDFHLHSIQPAIEQILHLQPGLNAEGIIDRHVASPVKGMTFMLAELASLHDLQTVGLTGAKTTFSLDAGWEHGFVATAFYVHTGDASDPQQYRTRMIESGLEDPATGSMSCALAAYLTLQSGKRRQSFEFTQGVEIGRRSDIRVDVELNEALDAVQTITLSGTAVHVMRGTIEI